MKTITWSIGSDSKLDNLFNNLREHQYQDKSHRLWQNYSKESFEYAGIIACTINFNDQQEPEMCSTISSRPCWPKNVYRILNRAWKHTNRTKTRIEISQGMGDSVISQIEWLKENTDYKMYFISRQTDNWMQWVSKKFDTQFGLKFSIAENKYLTCPNKSDNSCWQHIIYNGKKYLLKTWENCEPNR